MPASTSPSLLIRIRDPDAHEAWAEFLSLYSGVVRSYCIQRGLQPHDVDDVVQEVMTSISRAIGNFEYDPAQGRFRAWLGTITANKIKNHMASKFKNARVKSLIEQSSGEHSKHLEDPDTLWINIYSEKIFNAACSKVRGHFTQVTWQSFQRTWIEKKKVSEVAKELNIAIHSVYVNKSRVLKQIEAEIRVLADDLPIQRNNNLISG